jgi:radical SAM superfamily enzyme YgiQ (UPF0313 family)
MPKVILYNPQSSANRKPILPMSLLAVGAVLEGKHEYRIVDGNLEPQPLERLDSLLRSEAAGAVLALTVMPGPQLEQAVALCRELRRRHPGLVIVWGGYFPTQHWDSCLRAEYVDYVARGHGEHVFLRLLAELELAGQAAPAIERLQAIAGLAYRDGQGQPTSNPLAPIPHPARLPDWNFERLPMERYVRPTFLGSRTLGYHSSYGCPFFCNFCAVVNMVGGKWLPQSGDYVARIARLYKERWGVNAVEFYDNNFFTQQTRVAEFAEGIMDLGIRWWGEGRIDTMLKYSDNTWRLMRDSGLHMVFMGAESGSDETLRRMDKGGTMSTDKTLEIARVMNGWGIVPEFSFVMGNPPDPAADLRQTIAFIRKVKRVHPQAEIIMYLYTPVPLAGELYEDAKAEGFAFPETLEEWISQEWLDFSQRRSTTMPWLRQTLPGQLRDFERVLNAYYPTSTDAALTRGWRLLLRTVAAWRYHAKVYRFPLELRLLHRLVAYQRPETSGF